MFLYSQLKVGTYYRRAAGREGGGRTYYFQKIEPIDGSIVTVRWTHYDDGSNGESWTRVKASHVASEVADWISPELPDSGFIAQLPALPSGATARTSVSTPVVKKKEVPVAPPPPPAFRAQLLSNNKFYIPSNKTAEVCGKCKKPTQFIPLSGNNKLRYCPVCEA